MNTRTFKTITAIVLFFSMLFMASCGSKQIMYTVSFESNEGSAVSDIKVKKGELIPENICITKRDGFTFEKWYEDEDLKNHWDLQTRKVESNTKLYAKWEKKTTDVEPETTKFTVTFDGVPFEYPSGSTVSPKSAEIKEGQKFLGWYENGQLYDFNKPLLSNIELKSKYEVVNNEKETYTLTLEINSDEYNGDKVFKYTKDEIVTPPKVSKENHRFLGWYEDSAYRVRYSDKKITSNLTLYAKFVYINKDNDDVTSGSYNEAVYAKWGDQDFTKSEVYYSQNDENNWTAVDKDLIRGDLNEGTARVDIVGLKEGLYNLKIRTSEGKEILISDIYTEGHDRSGYAHFNYNEGVGAYNDDGTLKKNAVVVYVTEENKNNVSIPGLPQVGLGWIFNNAQYSKAESTTYDQAKAENSIARYDRPIVIRIIGKVTTPEGATGYDSYENGGSKGDNGHMVRMKDANNITIEGIGEDAVIEGWGFHFMASTPGRGIGLEVRNITFDKYPEDAIGLEGIQESGKLTVPVQRGWMHHLRFYAGFCANPAESDKAEGDGSLDIKRGMYFTVSYSEFIGAHKTNLVGSSDESLQYNLTFHHNLWKNNASRIPLARHANIHMYNNVFEITDDNPNATSYVQNTRATAYIFSEANYFYAPKNPSDVKDGAIKSYGDIKYSSYGTDNATVVTSRTEKVKSGNTYEDFDTNSSIFYYDDVLQKSKVKRLTDAITARAEVAAYSGTYKDLNKVNSELIKITDVTPTKINENISKTGGKVSKSSPYLVFEITSRAIFEMVDGNGSVPVSLVDIYGRVILNGTGNAMLESGIYVIESSISHGAAKGKSQAKEATLASYSLTFDTETAKEERINQYQKTVEALPTNVEFIENHFNLIMNAKKAYDSLMENEKLKVDYSKVENSENQYVSLGTTYVEELINNIGIVNSNSFSQIEAARKVYDSLLQAIKDKITNYDTLVKAELDFKEFEISNVDNLIQNLKEVDLVDMNLKDEVDSLLKSYKLVENSYSKLEDANKKKLNNSNKLLEGISKLEEMMQAHEINVIIDSIDLKNITKANSKDLVTAYNTYNNLKDVYKVIITDKDKLMKAYEKYNSLEGMTYIYNVQDDINTNGFFIISGTNNTQDIKEETINGVIIKKALKLESKTNIDFTTTKKTTLVIYIKAKKEKSNIIINNKKYDISSIELMKIEIVLENAGDYKIKKGSGDISIYQIEIIEQ